MSRRLTASALLLGAALLAGCGTPSVPARTAAQPSHASAVVSWSAPDQARLAPGSAISVTVTSGALISFRVTGGQGHTIATQGLTSAPLPPAGTFTATVTLTRSDGTGARTETRTVTTLAAQHQLRATVSPAAGATVGVGEPIVVTLNYPAVDHAAVERHLSVTTSRPVGAAGWYWFSDTRVEYRPRAYWPANTTVSVHAALTGIRTGQTTWGVSDTASSFTVGRSQLLKIDDLTHLMTVVRDGRAIRSVPVSLGQHQGTWITRSGVKTVMSIERTVHMDSSTVGISGPGAYDEIVPFAMRLTWSGEYIHGAPWSEWAQGSVDVSHGCTNISLVNAEWLFNNSLIGDVVETTGTGRPMEPENGTGGVWDISWANWQAGSALA